MAGEQADPYAARRAARRLAFVECFAQLPEAGTAAYWDVVERTSGDETLPLEVLVRCLLEQQVAYAKDHVARLFGAILRRIQPRTQAWAARTARNSISGWPRGLAGDLEQECYLMLWQEIAHSSTTFLLENFAYALTRIEQRVASRVMEREGEWIRPGVAHPRIIPRREVDRMDVPSRLDDEGEPAVFQIRDEGAERAFALVELAHDIGLLLAKLNDGARRLLYSTFWLCQTQEEIARAEGVTARTVRNRLTALLRRIRVLYFGAEESTRD